MDSDGERGNRYASAVEHQDMRARSMTVRALVRARLELRNMRLHRVIRQDHLGAFVRQATRFGDEKLNAVEIRNQTCIEDANRALLAFAKRCGAARDSHLRLIDGEIIRLIIVTIAKNEIVVEDEIGVVIEVHSQGQIHDRDQPRRRAAQIFMNAPNVERRREERSLLPFESLFGLVLMPDSSFAFAVENVDRFFEHITLRIS